MILRLYLFSLYFTTIVSGALALMIIINTDPYESPFWMILVFYLTIFTFILAVFGLIGFYLKVWASNREVIFAHLVPTLRQGAFVGMGVVGLLFLQQLRVLSWWVAFLLIFAIIFIELFFRSKKSRGY